MRQFILSLEILISEVGLALALSTVLQSKSTSDESRGSARALRYRKMSKESIHFFLLGSLKYYEL